MLIIDASVAVKAFVTEADYEKAAAIFEGPEALAAPAHMLAEVGEVLMRKQRLGEMLMAQVATALDEIPQAVAFIGLTDLRLQALEISNVTGASFYDSLYVAAAHREECMLVSADRRLIAKMEGSPYQRMVVPLAG